MGLEIVDKFDALLFYVGAIILSIIIICILFTLCDCIGIKKPIIINFREWYIISINEMSNDIENNRQQIIII